MIPPRLPWMLWMLRLKLFVNFIPVSASALLRVRIDPVPEDPLIFLRIFFPSSLRRLHNRAHSSDSTRRRTDGMIIQVLQSPIAN